jgi:alginate O-acetyltransferase complex protein AlgI
LSVYLPTGPAVVALGAAWLAATLALGFAVSRIRRLGAARAAAWGLALAAAAAAERLTADQPAGFRMLAIMGALLYGLKAVVAVESRAAGGARLGPAAWLGFAALWPGMRPDLFARRRPEPLRGAGALFGRGLAALAAGGVLVAAARAVTAAGGPLLLATVLVLPGLSLILHFGLFHLAAGAWRIAGVDARPLFRAPLRATSLTEFWGRRWNLAFSEMTALGVYRPLRSRWGTAPALTAAFLVSGLLHEAAISVPVGAGYGLPLAYFAVHAALMNLERRRQHAGRPLSTPAWRGRLWTLFWLALPLPLLFHRPFLAGVVWPLLR